MSKKTYIVDTNAILDNPNIIETLRNGNENNVLVPYRVLLELDKNKNNIKVSHLIHDAVENIKNHIINEEVTIINEDDYLKTTSHPDLLILKDALNYLKNKENDSPILITNDNIFSIFSKLEGIESEKLNTPREYRSECEIYTGLMQEYDDLYNKYINEKIPNYFKWVEGKPVYVKGEMEKIIDYEHAVWKVKPRHVTQNLAFELLLDNDINLVSFNGRAGFGKTMISMAVGLYLLLEKKMFDKIIFVKPVIEIGSSLGFLPGDVQEKTNQYFMYAVDMFKKLHSLRSANKIFIEKSNKLVMNEDIVEFAPVTYMRGRNIENSYVILDECQNFKKLEMRNILTRIGPNCKVVCLGDTRQIDSPYLNEYKNGLNYLVNKLKLEKNYAHMVITGKHSRGPVTDMILRSGL